MPNLEKIVAEAVRGVVVGIGSHADFLLDVGSSAAKGGALEVHHLQLGCDEVP